MNIQSNIAATNVEFSIVVPAYREAGSIRDVVDDIRRAASAVTSRFELIVVDDGSDDRTGELVLGGARVVSHPYNKGDGAVLKSGIRPSRGRTVVFMDADGQHRAQDLNGYGGVRIGDGAAGYRAANAGSRLVTAPLSAPVWSRRP